MPTILDPENELNIVVCGGGNAAHVLLGLLGSKPKYKVKLWNVVAKEVELFACKLDANDSLVRVRDLSGASEEVIDGRVDAVSTDPAELVPGADLLLIAVPAFVHETYLKASLPHVSEKTVIATMVAEGGWDWALRDTFKDKYASMVTFGMETLPWACRLVEYGRSADIKGVKKRVKVAVTPAEARDHVLRFLNSALTRQSLPDFQVCGSTLSPTLMNVRAEAAASPARRGRAIGAHAAQRPHQINALFHPAVVRGEFAHWDGTPFKGEAPLFYEGVREEEAGKILDAQSAEVMAIRKALEDQVPTIDLHSVVDLFEFFKSSYQSDILDTSTLASAMRTNKVRHPRRVARRGRRGSSQAMHPRATKASGTT